MTLLINADRKYDSQVRDAELKVSEYRKICRKEGNPMSYGHLQCFCFGSRWPP